MKIFLSGKMDHKLGAWRTELVGSHLEPDIKAMTPNWVIHRVGVGMEDFIAGSSQPTIRKSQVVLGLHDYVGPYRLEYVEKEDYKYIGEYHGSTTQGSHGCPTDEARETIMKMCLSGLRAADFVFAYINTPDCFGTVAEIGYARALGKYVYVLIEADAEWEPGDYWFLADLATHCTYVHRNENDAGGQTVPTIKELFSAALVHWSGSVEVQRANVVALPTEILQSFNAIQKWSSDPRVRNEARRILQKLG